MRSERMVVAVDPGTVYSAYALFVGGRVESFARVDMRPGPADEGLSGLLDFLHLAQQEVPGTLVVEDQFCRTRRGYKSLVLARGKVQGLFELWCWDVVEVLPSQWRKVLFRRNEKRTFGPGMKREEAQRRSLRLARRTLGLPALKDQDIADAVCMGLYFLSQCAQGDAPLDGRRKPYGRRK